MTFEDLLNEYMDGTLDDSSEQALFSAIATNDEYRRDFSDTIRVRTAVRQEAAAIGVPQSLSNSVFETLGYGVSETITSAGIIPWWRVFANGIKDSVPYLLTSAAGAGIMWFILSTTNSTQEHIISQAHNKTSVPSQAHTSVNNIYAENPANTISESPSVYIPTITRYYAIENAPNKKSVHYPDSDTASELNEIQNIQHSTNTETDIRETEYKKPSFDIVSSLENTMVQNTKPELSIMKPNGTETNNTEQFPLEFSIRSLQLTPQERVNVPDNNTLGINNIALALYYRFNSDWSMGIEAGRESFTQNYKRENDIAIESISQYPTLWWGGISGRYEARSLLGNSLPFPNISSSVGLAETGGYLRTSAGIGWDIVPSVTMNIGAEWAQLFYTAQSNSYNSTNFGWMYGFTIRF